MEMKPFYEVILDRIEEKVHIIPSRTEQSIIEELGDILGRSIMPEFKRPDVALRLRRMALRLQFLKTMELSEYLLKLSKRIEET